MGLESELNVLRMIRDIVASNRDIKVWNLSLGSILEIKKNFISPEAYELDRIQRGYDVIFVVEGNNKPFDAGTKKMMIGSPADSLNSVVVNSVDFRGNSASYTISGPVLSFLSVYEEDARKMYRKWDNIKYISEKNKKQGRPRKAYESGMCGLSIKTKERTTSKDKTPLQFGVVVTLKEMNGVNRINNFIKMCMARNWLVTRLDIENQLDIYAKAEEKIKFKYIKLT